MLLIDKNKLTFLRIDDLVPSFPTKDAIDVIEAELGQPVQEMFADLDQDTR